MTVFFGVGGAGLLLVALGFAALLYFIPRLTAKGGINTEFLSARAASWCVATGLILLLLAALEASVKDALRGWSPQSTVIKENVDVSR